LRGEQFARHQDNLLDLVKGLWLDECVGSIDGILQVLESDAQLLLVEVRLLQYLVLEVLQGIGVPIVQVVLSIGVSPQVFVDGVDHVLLDVLEQGLDEGSADLSDSALEPHIVVQEVSLAC
jgi:hypothetical protein